MSKLSHLDEHGAARMVDVSEKESSAREATGEAVVAMSQEAFALIRDEAAPKGDVLATARIAGIMAAKKTSELIPLCHPLSLTKANVDFALLEDRCAVQITATVKTTGQTGVEMEALTAASIAALTVYDMIKAVDREAVIGGVRLIAKSGGKSGDYRTSASGGEVEKAGGTRSAQARTRPAPRGKPSTLMGEVAMPVAKAPSLGEREAFRAFMTSRRLRATEWAKEAGVPAAEIYAYLTGRARSLPRETADRLARAARVRLEDMFR